MSSLQMAETDKMSDSKCYVLNTIGSIGVEISLTNASSSLTKEAVHETNSEQITCTR
jgi:hypothetical protein